MDLIENMQTEKLQYYASDLSQHLDIGEILDMHVATTENGRQVLRIECMKKEDGEYKTVRASKPAARKAKTPKEPKPKPLNFEREVPEPNTSFGAKAAKFGGDFGKGVVEWIRTPPRKRPEDW